MSFFAPSENQGTKNVCATIILFKMGVIDANIHYLPRYHAVFVNGPRALARFVV